MSLSQRINIKEAICEESEGEKEALEVPRKQSKSYEEGLSKDEMSESTSVNKTKGKQNAFRLCLPCVQRKDHPHER